MFSRRRCCCNGIDVSGCSQCSGSGGRGPNQFQAVISGATVPGGFPPCCDLNDVNGTWVLTYNGTICAWIYDITGGSLGTWTCLGAVDTVRHSLTIAGVNSIYRIAALGGGITRGQMTWSYNTSPTNIDCFGLSSTSYTAGSSSACVIASSTNLVTSL